MITINDVGKIATRITLISDTDLYKSWNLFMKVLWGGSEGGDFRKRSPETSKRSGSDGG